jgi:hypothetical protein
VGITSLQDDGQVVGRQYTMNRKLTITVSEAVYEGLHRMAGPRRISQLIEKLARPHVVPQDLAASYRDMAADRSGPRA